MEISQDDSPKGGEFRATDNGEVAGTMTYSWAIDKIIIEHTVVKDKFSGQGVGKQLVMAAVEFARMNGITIIPVCPFAKKVLERDESFFDVLDIDVP